MLPESVAWLLILVASVVALSLVFYPRLQAAPWMRWLV